MRKPTLGVIFLTVLIDLLGFGIVMPFLILEARNAFHVSAGTAALLGACYSAMQFLFMPLWGRLSDRIGRRPVMLISILASALTMAATGAALAWSASILWMFVARAASGISTANIGTASAYIADITTPEQRVKGMGLIGMAFGLGFLIGPGVGGLLAKVDINGRHGPWACFAAAGLSTINLIWALTSLPESLPPARRGTRKRSASPIQLDALWRTLTTAGIGKAALTNHLIILAFSGLEVTYALYASDAFGLTQDRVGYLFIFMGVIGALVQGVFVRRVSGKVRETSLIYGGLALMTVGFAGFVGAPSVGLSALWVVSALIAMGNGLTQPGLSAYISRLADPTKQGEALSSNQSLAALARTFGPMIAGYFYAVSPRVPFAACTALNLLAVVAALGMRHVQPARSLPLKTA
jgi:DHA1 family tetracycline resistance protein-like MFS transporter